MKARIVLALALILVLLMASSAPVAAKGAFTASQYVRLATLGCPAPALMLVDGVYVYVCPPVMKLPPLPRR